MNKIIEYATYVLLAASMIMLIMIGYMGMFQDNPPITFEGNHKIVKVTDTEVFTETRLCRNTDVPATLYVSFVNGVMYSLPAERVVGQGKGCITSYRTFNIPPELDDGRYYLYGISEFKINAIKTRQVEWRSDYFEINRKGD